MPTFKSSSVQKVPITLSQAGQIVAAVGEVEAPDSLAADDIVALCHLPAGHEPIDFMLQSDDLDDGTGISMTAAVLNADMTDVLASTDFITTSTIGRTGGVARANQLAGLQLAASDADRVVGVKIAAAATTPQAGTIKGVLLYKRKQS